MITEEHMLEFLTDEGKKMLELVSQYQLDEYVNIMAGNIVIEDQQMNFYLMSKCLEFIRNNPEWVMGYEIDENNGIVYSAIWYIAEKSNL